MAPILKASIGLILAAVLILYTWGKPHHSMTVELFTTISDTYIENLVLETSHHTRTSAETTRHAYIRVIPLI